jgi:hypothetical protein
MSRESHITFNGADNQLWRTVYVGYREYVSFLSEAVPASTTVGVTALADRPRIVEIEADVELERGQDRQVMALTGFRRRSGAWPWPSSSAKALDYGKQSLPVEGLGHKSRGPVLNGFLRSIVERGEHHHGHVGECPISALLGTELPTIHHRHHEVEQNQSRQAFGVTHQVKRLAAISGALHFVPQPREHFCKCFTLAALILDDENLRIHKKQRHQNRDEVRILSKDRSLKRNVISRLASDYS